jgi:hypothetical protein
MDHYTGERWLLERHQAMIRAAEIRSRLIPVSDRARTSLWLAAHLRRLADRLDGQRQQPAAPHFISDSQS